MRRLIMSIAATACMVGLTGLPAAADAPTPVIFEEVVIGAISPCTGLEHDIYLTFDGQLHVHEQNLVRTGAFSSGYTSDGYVLIDGREQEMFNDQNGRFVLTFYNTWINEDDGSRFATNGQFVADFDTGEWTRYNLNSRCVGN